jgi:hypothetical protein
MSRDSSRPGDSNRVYGLDSTFRLLGDVDWNSYVVKTSTPGKSGKDYAARTSLNREGRFFHGKAGVLAIGDNFQDDLGYFRRVGIRKWFFDTGLRPRPEGLRKRGVREMHPHMVWDYFQNIRGGTVGKNFHNGYTFFLNNGGFTELSVNNKYQLIGEPFAIRGGSPAIPAGGYGWTEYQLRGDSDPSRPLTFSFTAITGGLWSGTQRTLNWAVGVRPSYRFRVNVGLQRTSARLAAPTGRFVTQLWTARANYSFNTNMFLDSLVQYDRDQRAFNANVRFNFIHRPLSDVFVVFNEQRISSPFPTIDDPAPGRSLILKVTRSFSF